MENWQGWRINTYELYYSALDEETGKTIKKMIEGSWFCSED
jgi:hypothetical protein